MKLKLWFCCCINVIELLKFFYILVYLVVSNFF